MLLRTSSGWQILSRIMHCYIVRYFVVGWCCNKSNSLLCGNHRITSSVEAFSTVPIYQAEHRSGGTPDRLSCKCIDSVSRSISAALLFEPGDRLVNLKSHTQQFETFRPTLIDKVWLAQFPVKKSLKLKKR